MANYLLKPGEQVRTVTVIIWQEELLKRYAAELPEFKRKYGEKAAEKFAQHVEAKLHAYLADMLVPVCCSPLHDHDTYSEEDVKNWVRRHIDPDTGEVYTELTNTQPKVGDPKKPHWHVIMYVGGPKDRNGFSEMMYELVYIPVTRWSRVPHIKTLTRYMSHMDNPEKYRYADTAIKAWGNYDLKPLTITKSDEYDRMVSLCEVMQYVEDNNIRYYHILVRWALNIGDYDLISCVTGRASFFIGYFKSISQEKADKKAEKAEKAAKDEEKAKSVGY